jgi:hypothetical protein
MLMGGFEITDFALSSEAIMVFVIFMVIVQLVMLNMLIAIMGDSVAQVQEDQKAAGLCSRAQLILTCQDSGGRSAFSIPKWLKCKCCSSASDDQITEKKFFALPQKTEAKQWSGVVDQVKQAIKQQKKQQSLEMDSVRNKVELIEHKLDTKVESIGTKVDSIEQKLDMLIKGGLGQSAHPSSPSGS